MPSEPLFKVGDVVALRSGSPPLTVFRVYPTPYVGQEKQPPMYDVNWFVRGEVKRDSFAEPELVGFSTLPSLVDLAAYRLARNVHTGMNAWIDLELEERRPFQEAGLQLVSEMLTMVTQEVHAKTVAGEPNAND